MEHGAFRGPTLRLTDRWISVDRLLTATTGTSLAAFVLARKAEMALRAAAPGDAPTGVFQVEIDPPAAGSAPQRVPIPGRAVLCAAVRAQCRRPAHQASRCRPGGQ